MFMIDEPTLDENNRLLYGKAHKSTACINVGLSPAKTNAQAPSIVASAPSLLEKSQP